MQNVNPVGEFRQRFSERKPSLHSQSKFLYWVNPSKPKILFIVTQSEMGGTQRYIMEVVPGLASEYQVLVAGGGNGALFKKISNACPVASERSEDCFGVKCQKLKYLKRMPLPCTAILSVREIYKLLKKERPDVLFLCSTMAGILGSIAGFLYKKSIRNSQHSHKNSQHSHYIIYRIGGWAFNDPRPWWQKKLILFLEKATARFKNKIIVNSEFDLQCALRHKVTCEEKLVKIYNGIDPEKTVFLPKLQVRKLLAFRRDRDKMLTAEASFNQEEKLKIVGAIANFYKTKGLRFLIEAFRRPGLRQLAETESPSALRLMIIGDGPERKHLEKLISEYKLQDKVFLLGRIPEARKYLKAFDIFVLPSLKEGFPWVVLEAMAAGVPVVATSVGAVPEILENNKSGFVVEPGNAEILAKKIQELLQNPELRASFARSAKEALQRFSQKKMFEETKRIIKKGIF